MKSQGTTEIPVMPDIPMSGHDLTKWVEHMGCTKKGAARMLGISRTSLDRYLQEGAPVTVGLACAALAFGLPVWRSVASEG